jgi:hypothetical protein
MGPYIVETKYFLRRTILCVKCRSYNQSCLKKIAKYFTQRELAGNLL